MPSWNELPLPEDGKWLRVMLSEETIKEFRVLAAENGFSMAAVVRIAMNMLAKDGAVSLDDVIPEMERLRAEADVIGKRFGDDAPSKRKARRKGHAG